MIGVVVATHGEFGSILLSTMEMILGGTEGITAVSLSTEDAMETFQEKLETALQTVDPSGQGALVLVDMLGGTPFNVAARLARKGKLIILTGVNLPMLIKAASRHEAGDLSDFAQEVQKSARESILSSADLFK